MGIGGMFDELMERDISLPMNGSMVTDVVSIDDDSHIVNISEMTVIVTGMAGPRRSSKDA
jgi:hypothetical protein